MSNVVDVLIETGTAYTSAAPMFMSVLSEVRVDHYFSFLCCQVLVCLSLFCVLFTMLPCKIECLPVVIWMKEI